MNGDVKWFLCIDKTILRNKYQNKMQKFRVFEISFSQNRVKRGLWKKFKPLSSFRVFKLAKADNKIKLGWTNLPMLSGLPTLKAWSFAICWKSFDLNKNKCKEVKHGPTSLCLPAKKVEKKPKKTCPLKTPEKISRSCKKYSSHFFSIPQTKNKNQIKSFLSFCFFSKRKSTTEFIREFIQMQNNKER